MKRLPLAILVVAGVLAGACGSSGDDESSATTTTTVAPTESAPTTAAPAGDAPTGLPAASSWTDVDAFLASWTVAAERIRDQTGVDHVPALTSEAALEMAAVRASVFGEWLDSDTAYAATLDPQSGEIVGTSVFVDAATTDSAAALVSQIVAGGPDAFAVISAEQAAGGQLVPGLEVTGTYAALTWRLRRTPTPLGDDQYVFTIVDPSRAEIIGSESVAMFVLAGEGP